MGNKVIYCSFLVLLFVTFVPGISSHDHDRADDVLRLPSMKQHEGGGHHVAVDGGADKELEDVGKAFATMKDFKVGTTRAFYIPYVDRPSFGFFPGERTRSIPVSTRSSFPLDSDSPLAAAFKRALEFCEGQPPKGEVNVCATSLESLLEFASSAFGSEYTAGKTRILTSPPVPKSNRRLQNYTVVESKVTESGKMIPCHFQPYPYPMYYCHFELGGTNKLFRVSLSSDNGEKITAVFVCHMHTSSSDAHHDSYAKLGFKTGQSEVCHLLPPHDMVVLPK
ncbi:hypothetical protein GQ457_16G001210 [Hibiscus cannabinus]